MARPNSAIRGFIEVEWEGNLMLLSIENILAVIPTNSRTVIALKDAIDQYGTKRGTINLSYDEVLFLIRDATR